MAAKFYLRTFRSLLFRGRPFFVHLAITHVCNLQCSFCSVPQTKVAELDTERMKRVFDKLDQMGVAYVSLTGGEPLLRPDFATLIDYGVAKGMRIHINSNGTMSRAKYQELLATPVHEIAISLDGVRGNLIPYAHVGPKILETIHFVNDHLPADKKLVLNITISNSNRDQVDGIVDYCTREFPRARMWLHPVMVGQGQYRAATQEKVNPDFLRRVSSPTLVAPEYFKRATEEYYRRETYNWGCLAGEMFFDIKPNGDFWICQDFPARPPLNILDPDFDRKYREADFSQRRQCSGCAYSCYWNAQKSFEPENWKDFAGVWWNATTEPNEPCRRTAKEKGWVLGLAHLGASRALRAAQRTAKKALALPGGA